VDRLAERERLEKVAPDEVHPRAEQGFPLGGRAAASVFRVERAALTADEHRPAERARLPAHPAADLLEVRLLEVGHVQAFTHLTDWAA
jgi:hypothetical protein